MSIHNKILLFLHEHAGSNRHDIANACDVSPYDALFMGVIYDLHDLRLIRNESTTLNPTQMEFYYKWYLTEKGEEFVKILLTAQG